MTDLAARNAAIVRRFIDGWKAKDADLLMSMCTDDIEYINQPLAPVVGQKNVRMIIEGILKLTDRVEWELLNVVAQGNVVATERLDRWDFTGSGSWELELPAVGMFDVTEDGKISGWRDFFDNQLWFGKGGPRLHLEFDK